MCGFLVYIDLTDGVDTAAFARALTRLNHRGPDDEGFAASADFSGVSFHDRTSFLALPAAHRPRLAMGHKRLSIVDLTSASRQPCVDERGRSAMVFNGEIYNYRDLSRRAETAHSDTLTLFDHLNHGGIDHLSRLNGMWGFAYTDIDSGKMFLSRDRYGKKPVYYYRDDHRFIAASEMKAIFALLPPEKQTRRVTPGGLTYYLLGKQTPFLNDGSSFYEGIHTVRPGETIAVDLRTLHIHPHAQNHFHDFDTVDFGTASDAQILTSLRHDITESIRTRLKTEVPVTILASGGVDSSWIAGVAAQGLKEFGNLSLYTCHIMDGQDKPNEDLAATRRLALSLGLDLQEISVDPTDAKRFTEICRDITRQVEMPVNFFLSTIPTYLMTRDMRERGIKVVLDGVGGDEMMGGYPAFHSLFMAAMNHRHLALAAQYYLTWRAFYRPGADDMFALMKSGVKALFTDSGIKSTPDIMRGIFAPMVKPAALPRTFAEFTRVFTREKMDRLSDRQQFEIDLYQLPYYLGIADQMSMIHSIENRSPFLDARLNQYLRMPDHLKFNKGFNKYALRRTMPDNIPDDLRWRPGKMGIGNAFSQTLMEAEEINDAIMDSGFLKDVFDMNRLSKMIKGNAAARNTVRPLFSLALLDHEYGLEMGQSG